MSRKQSRAFIRRLEAVERQRKVLRLRRQGLTEVQIADKIGCCQATVSKDINEHIDKLISYTRQDAEKQRAEELDRIEEVRQKALRGWQRSCGDEQISDVEVIDVEVVGGGEKSKPATHKRKMRTKGQTGDPRFLAVLMNCVEKRCRLLGLNLESQQQATVGDQRDPGTVEQQAAAMRAMMFGEPLRLAGPEGNGRPHEGNGDGGAADSRK